MYLTLGDWSDDGHGKYDKILVETNQPIDKIRQAYKDSCKLTTVSFNHNEDFTGVKRDYLEVKKYRICSEYDNNSIPKESVEILSKYEGFSDLDFEDYKDELFVGESFVKFWFWFVKLSLPELEYAEINEKIPSINGYWDKDLNVQFGYGLYA